MWWNPSKSAVCNTQPFWNQQPCSLLFKSLKSFFSPISGLGCIFTSSTCLNALYLCHVIGWLAIWVNKELNIAPIDWLLIYELIMPAMCLNYKGSSGTADFYMMRQRTDEASDTLKTRFWDQRIHVMNNSVISSINSNSQALREITLCTWTHTHLVFTVVHTVGRLARRS